MNASLEYCKQNKPKLYELAEKGETSGLPGYDLEYDKPENAKLVFKPEENEMNIEKVMDYLAMNKIFPHH